MQIEAVGDRSVMVRLGREMNSDIHAAVRRLFLGLARARPAGVVNLHPAYASVLVDFDPLGL